MNADWVCTRTAVKFRKKCAKDPEGLNSIVVSLSNTITSLRQTIDHFISFSFMMINHTVIHATKTSKYLTEMSAEFVLVPKTLLLN